MTDALTSARDAYDQAVLEADEQYERLLKSESVYAADEAFEGIVAPPRKAYDKALRAAHKIRGGGVDEPALIDARTERDSVLQIRREAASAEREQRRREGLSD